MTLVKSKSKKRMFHITASRGYTEAGKLCPCFLCLMCTLYLFVLKKKPKNFLCPLPVLSHSRKILYTPMTNRTAFKRLVQILRSQFLHSCLTADCSLKRLYVNRCTQSRKLLNIWLLSRIT